MSKDDLGAWLAPVDRDVRREGTKVRAVTVKRRYGASIDRVWKAWTEGWKTKVVSGEPRPGETVVLDLGQPNRTTCRILACDPPHRLAVTWTYGEPTEIAPDQVEVRLSESAGGTMLELEHRSESGSPWAAGVGAGWEAGLMMFDYLFRGDDPAKIPAGAFPALDAFWTELVEKGS